MQKTEQKLINLQPGDVIFEVNPTPERTLEAKHCWIFVSQEPRMAHSAVGDQITGVSRHTPKDEYVAQNDKVIFIRCKNKELKDLIIKVAESFAPILNSEQIKVLKVLNIKKDNSSKTNVWKENKILYTPYSMMREESTSIELNIFRAVRAALRTGLTGGKKAPLSKICGVSCDEFVGYTIQAALVIWLLGKKLNQMQDLVDSISAARQKKDGSGNKNPASELLQKICETFNKLAKDHNLPEDIKELKVKNAIKFPVKGGAINRSLSFWQTSPFFEEVEGHFSLNPPKVKPLSLIALLDEPKPQLPFGDGDDASEGDDSNFDGAEDAGSEDSFDGLLKKAVIGNENEEEIFGNEANLLADAKLTHSEPQGYRHDLNNPGLFASHNNVKPLITQDDAKLLKRAKAEKQTHFLPRSFSF